MNRRTASQIYAINWKLISWKYLRETHKIAQIKLGIYIFYMTLYRPDIIIKDNDTAEVDQMCFC